MAKWNPFPHSNDEFLFEGDRLADAWADLHCGDGVVFPDISWVEAQLEQSPEAAPEEYDGDAETLAATIQDSWRCFHSGDFQQAVQLAEQCGYLAHAAANKATGIYGTYLEPDEARQQACFQLAVSFAESAVQVLPGDANSHYFHAFNLGRYSQSISIVKALSQGMGGKIHASLQAALELNPDHAEAHTALGMYHAEIIDKVGKMLGKMTYGASASAALKHFDRALELTPDAPIAHIEYGNGLYLLYGDDRWDDVSELYVKASEMQPRDAMEKLDIEAVLENFE